MQERAHAKVNLVLSVTPRVCEGAYHEVRTVMCALGLHDEVELCELAAGEGLVFSCEPDPLPAGADPAANLAYRAAVGMAEAFDAADGDTFEEIILRAADKLGVEVI